MARNEPLNYLTARDLWNEIRAEPGWAAKHGFQDGKIGVWLSRTSAPAITPVFLTSRDQWLWLRDMLQERAGDGAPVQAPLPLDPSAGDRTRGEAAAAAPTRATAPNDLHRLADSQHASDTR